MSPLIIRERKEPPRASAGRGTATRDTAQARTNSPRARQIFVCENRPIFCSCHLIAVTGRATHHELSTGNYAPLIIEYFVVALCRRCYR